MSFSFSAIMDVAVGLFFVFLLVSLVCSQINDKIGLWLRMRAKGLEEGLRKFITGNTNLKQSIYDNALIQTLIPEDPLATQLLEKTPGLKNLIRSGPKPLGIPKQTFVLALLNILVPNPVSGLTTVGQLQNAVNGLSTDSPIRAPLLSIISTANNDIEAARKNIEAWFEVTMDKTTKLYQAHMWRLALIIGLGVAIVLNVDTLSIATSLWNDSSLRSALVAEAGSYVQNSPQQQAALDKLNTLKLPIGWNVVTRPNICVFPNDWFTKPQLGATNPVPQNDPCSPPALPQRAYLFKIAGWLLTAIAGAQGAPFWFDLLRKLTTKPA